MLLELLKRFPNLSFLYYWPLALHEVSHYLLHNSAVCVALQLPWETHRRHRHTPGSLFYEQRRHETPGFLRRLISFI
jgi:hypothetical protein